jgi:hypothetical protein
MRVVYGVGGYKNQEDLWESSWPVDHHDMAVLPPEVTVWGWGFKSAVNPTQWMTLTTVFCAMVVKKC